MYINWLTKTKHFFLSKIFHVLPANTKEHHIDEEILVPLLSLSLQLHFRTPRDAARSSYRSANAEVKSCWHLSTVALLWTSHAEFELSHGLLVRGFRSVSMIWHWACTVAAAAASSKKVAARKNVKMGNEKLNKLFRPARKIGRSITTFTATDPRTHGGLYFCWGIVSFFCEYLGV